MLKVFKKFWYNQDIIHSMCCSQRFVSFQAKRGN